MNKTELKKRMAEVIPYLKETGLHDKLKELLPYVESIEYAVVDGMRETLKDLEYAWMMADGQRDGRGRRTNDDADASIYLNTGDGWQLTLDISNVEWFSVEPWWFMIEVGKANIREMKMEEYIKIKKLEKFVSDEK